MSDEITKLKEICTSNSCENVGIFVDFDNIYYGLKDYAIDLNDEKNCIFKALNEIYGMDRIRTFRAYADFDQIKTVSLRTLQEKRVQIRNVYGNGKDEKYRKNASDIELSIDAIESSYKNSEIDTFVFVTADSDMIPVMSRIIYKGKKVHLYYINENTSQYQSIENFAHNKIDILDLLKIEKKRSQAEYWETETINLINNWYSNVKGDKMLGSRWLNEELQKELHMSHNLASSVIEYMERNSIIKKEPHKSNPKNEGYVVCQKS